MQLGAFEDNLNKFKVLLLVFICVTFQLLVYLPSLACQQVKEEDDNPRVPPSKDRRQESVAGPKSEELVPPPN